MDLSTFFTPEVLAALKIFAIIVTIVHMFVVLILFNFIRTVSRQVRTPSEGLFKFIGIVHIGLIAVILLGIIFLF